jgi:hypothetical protein
MIILRQNNYSSKPKLDPDMTEEDAEAIGKWLKDEGGSDVYRRAYRDEKRKHAKRGRRIGAAAGTLGGAALVPLFGNDEDYKSASKADKAGYIVAGSILGAGAGLLNGHIAGNIAGRKSAKKKATKEREDFERLVDETTEEMKKDIRSKKKSTKK